MRLQHETRVNIDTGKLELVFSTAEGDKTCCFSHDSLNNMNAREGATGAEDVLITIIEGSFGPLSPEETELVRQLAHPATA